MLRLSKEYFFKILEMLRIQIASNFFVHQNYTWKQGMKLLTPGKADNLALLGNIGNPNSPKTKDFVRWCSENWKQVYCVPGALELQHRDNLYKLYPNIPSNIHILDNTEVINNNFTILGSPLWSRYGKKLGELGSLSERDRYFMAHKTPVQIQHYHEEDLEYINERLRYLGNSLLNRKRVILLTHWLPTKKLLAEQLQFDRNIYLHVGDVNYILNDTIAGCISGAGGATQESFIGNHYNPIVPCYVNSAFRGPDMVPNPRYNRQMIVEFSDQDPSAIDFRNNQTDLFIANVLKYLPKPRVVNAYPNLQ